MDTRAGLLLLFLLRCVGSAPSASDGLLVPSDAKKALSLVEKIYSEIPQVQHSTQALILDPSSLSVLQSMVASLGIPRPPAPKPPSAHFSLEQSVSCMVSGVRVHEQVILVLSGRVFGLTELHTDLKDLLSHLTKMAATQLEGSEPTSAWYFSSRLSGDYEVQVATDVALTHLRIFCKDLIRSLRVVDTYGP